MTYANTNLGLYERYILRRHFDGTPALWVERDERGYTLNDDRTASRADDTDDLDADVAEWDEATK